MSNYYAHLARPHRAPAGLPLHAPAPTRILLLPLPHPAGPAPAGAVLYAPVPLAALSPQAAHDLRASATEAWVAPAPEDAHAHAHGRHRRYSAGATGRICLPVAPGEGLLADAKA